MSKYTEFEGKSFKEFERVVLKSWEFTKGIVEQMEGVEVIGKDRATWEVWHQLLDKHTSPYNYFRERMLQEKAEAAVEFVPAADKADAYDTGDEVPKTLKWGPEGTATEKDGKFIITYDDGRDSAILDKKFLNHKQTASGGFYTTKIKEVPTNIFPKDGVENLWSVHEYKMRDAI